MPRLTLASAASSSALRSLAGLSAQRTAADAQGRALDTRSLLSGHRAVTLVHNGTAYRLQATRLGKLILTK